jgi:hypothetical protein
MPLPRDFEKMLAEKTNEQLYEMVACGTDYSPEALAAAHAEIERRSLEPAQVGQLEELSEKIIAERAEAAEEPLSWPVRLTMFVFAFGVIQMIVADNYRGRGYTRKAQEAWKWMWYGLGSWTVVWTIMFLLNR